MSKKVFKSTKNTKRHLVFALSAVLFAHSVSAEEQLNIKLSCEQLRSSMRSLQKSQFQLKDADKTLYDLTKEHDREIAELAIIKGIKDLKAEYTKARAELLEKPVKDLQSSIERLNKGRLIAGKMAAVESFVHELKNSPELEGALEQLKKNGEVDPTSVDPLMKVAEQECSKEGAKPVFCNVLNEEDKRASNVFRAAASIVTGNERRPIRKTVEEFAKTYQVIGANSGSPTFAMDKLAEFEKMLKDDEGIPADAFHDQMNEILGFTAGQSEMIAIDMQTYERCMSAAAARGSDSEMSKCRLNTDQSEKQEKMILGFINQSLSNPEFANKHKISLLKIKGDLNKVKAMRILADAKREQALSDNPELKAKYNGIAKSAMDKMSYIYETLKKRNITGTIDDYFKNDKNKNVDATGVALENFRELLKEVNPNCAQLADGFSERAKVDMSGKELSSCLGNLNQSQQKALDDKLSASQGRVDALQARIDKIKSGQDYQGIDKLKTYTARSYVSGGDCTQEGIKTEYISSCSSTTGVNLGFETISRLTDSADQILFEYQADKLGTVETREGAKAYSDELVEVCKSDNVAKASPTICNNVSLYREVAHTPTKVERYKEEFRTKEVYYDLKTKKHVVENRKSVITNPIVIEAATRNILGVGGAIIQGRNAYDASLADGTARLNMAWTNYYLNQYYYYNSPFFSGGYSLGGYPFALTRGSSIPDTSTYYSIQ